MAITIEHYLEHRPKRRRTWPWILVLMTFLATGLVATLALHSNQTGASEAGIGKALKLAPIEKLPEWARQVIHEQQLGADYQFVATLIDLDRDQQYEILLAPAPPRADLFIARHPLAIIQKRNNAWHYQATTVSCRPTRLGSFMTNGVWDLPCRTVNRSTVLRWSGSSYMEAG